MSPYQDRWRTPREPESGDRALRARGSRRIGLAPSVYYMSGRRRLRRPGRQVGLRAGRRPGDDLVRAAARLSLPCPAVTWRGVMRRVTGLAGQSRFGPAGTFRPRPAALSPAEVGRLAAGCLTWLLSGARTRAGGDRGRADRLHRQPGHLCPRRRSCPCMTTQPAGGPGAVNLWPMPDTAGEDVAVIIPARNEQLRIAATVTAAACLSSLVVVVDDASRDQAAHRAREAGALVVSRRRSHGKVLADALSEERTGCLRHGR